MRSLNAPRKGKKNKKTKKQPTNFGDVWRVLPAVPEHPRSRRELLAACTRGPRYPSATPGSRCGPACPGEEAERSRLPSSRLLRVSPRSAEAAGLGCPGDSQGFPASVRQLNKERRDGSASRGRLESHQRLGDAGSEGARRRWLVRAGPRRHHRSFSRAPRPDIPHSPLPLPYLGLLLFQ